MARGQREPRRFTADVTRPVPVSGLVAVPLGSGLLVEDPAVETTTTTSTTLPGRYVHLPDVSAGTTKAVDSAPCLGPWTGAVALAFRLGDDRLLALVEAHPDLADDCSPASRTSSSGASPRWPSCSPTSTCSTERPMAGRTARCRGTTCG